MDKLLFQKRLKELRSEVGCTQEDMANKLNISKSAYGYYEQGKTTPDSNSISMLADFFNVSTDYLLGRTNIRNHPETFAAHTDEDMSDEAKAELENFKEFLKMKYGK